MRAKMMCSNIASDQREKMQEAFKSNWPHADLEKLSSCPACDNSKREQIYSGLSDIVFEAAPGSWNLESCTSCGCAFLNPRPTKKSIHRAYYGYYTHEVPPKRTEYSDLALYRRIRRRLVNGYTRYRFGSNDRPFSSFGLTLKLIPFATRGQEREYRSLPKVPGQLLDVGCGSGAFLKHAQNCGWEAIGIDPDPVAIETCRMQGLKVVLGNFECLRTHEQKYDYVTLSHVIEHVHEPKVLIGECMRVLKPGGRLWLETPNINSLGHRLYREHWRGLEVPRHLVIFNRKAITDLLDAAGFCDIRREMRSSAVPFIFRASSLLSLKQSSERHRSLGLFETSRMYIATAMEELFPETAEFITLSAQRPS